MLKLNLPKKELFIAAGLGVIMFGFQM
ncbi:MAG: hypothetical protein ACI8SA_000637, partial [Dokdonia sp.]